MLTWPWCTTTTAKDLIRKLLVRDPEQRPSAAEILKHPWIATAELSDDLESSCIDLRTSILVPLSQPWRRTHIATPQ
jgi:serine/threonine protein kinase